jgi:cytochrome o ubiquinol oxidase subunit 2
MSKKLKVLICILLVLAMVALAVIYLRGHNFAVLNPQGEIASKERSLMITTLLLSVIVVVPVFAMTIFIVWKYRASNKKVKKHYKPDWDRQPVAEFFWWAIPCLIITVLAVLTWTSSHDLDPYKSLSSSKKPLQVQVVALDWKWLFIYPEQKLATVNYFAMPVGTPVNFQITSDAPMNSFWVPQLGGQTYAMSGMSTQLHLIADHAGNYNGSSANISGKGFAGMRFVAQAMSPSDFGTWLKAAKASPKHLSDNEYKKLAKPSEYNPRATYSDVSDHLYDRIVVKYMQPLAHEGHAHGESD